MSVKDHLSTVENQDHTDIRYHPLTYMYNTTVRGRMFKTDGK